MCHFLCSHLSSSLYFLFNFVLFHFLFLLCDWLLHPDQSRHVTVQRPCRAAQQLRLFSLVSVCLTSSSETPRWALKSPTPTPHGGHVCSTNEPLRPAVVEAHGQHGSEAFSAKLQGQVRLRDHAHVCARLPCSVVFVVFEACCASHKS